ncbi:MAG: hypothetical protein AAFQ40_04365 [Cyanobacteria bacterium J06623_5]
MRFTRVMGELALAVGAVSGILFVVSPQIPAVNAQLPLKSSVNSLLKPSAVPAQDLLGLGKLVGIAQFVKNPARYHLAYGGNLASVTGATLDGDRLIIEYAYLGDGLDGGEPKTGTLTGTVDSDGKFSGNYLTKLKSEGKIKTTQGELQFTFAADGTAAGHPSEGQEITGLFL